MNKDMNKNDLILAEHRIDRVELLHFRQRYPRFLGKNAIKGDHGFGGQMEAARITTDKGARGWGLLSRPAETAKQMQERIMGKPLGEIFSCDEGILSDDLKVFDIPLHDLAGRVLGISVAEMISRDAAAGVPVYDGAIYINDIIPEEAPMGIQKVLDDCADDIALGHRTLKIKIGRGRMWMDHDAGMQRDIEIVSRIHELYPSVTLMVDANDGYTTDDALAFLEGIRNVPLYWFEEPMREEENSFRALRDYMRSRRPLTLIADGESNTDMPLLFNLAEKGLLDVWQPDLCFYGFTEWRKLLKQITPLGYMASPHAWDCVLKTNYCAHLAAAYPLHVPYVEAVIGECEGIDASGYILRDGMMSLPEAPGFGMELQYAVPLDIPL